MPGKRKKHPTQLSSTHKAAAATPLQSLMAHLSNRVAPVENDYWKTAFEICAGIPKAERAEVAMGVLYGQVPSDRKDEVLHMVFCALIEKHEPTSTAHVPFLSASLDVCDKLSAGERRYHALAHILYDAVPPRTENTLLRLKILKQAERHATATGLTDAALAEDTLLATTSLLKDAPAALRPYITKKISHLLERIEESTTGFTAILGALTNMQNADDALDKKAVEKAITCLYKITDANNKCGRLFELECTVLHESPAAKLIESTIAEILHRKPQQQSAPLRLVAG